MKFHDGQSEFSQVFMFAIFCYSRNSQRLDARENLVFTVILAVDILTAAIVVYSDTGVPACVNVIKLVFLHVYYDFSRSSENPFDFCEFFISNFIL